MRSVDSLCSEKMTIFGDLLHALDDLRQQRVLLSRAGGLAILDWWLATTGASALVPLAGTVEDFAWSSVILMFVVSKISLRREPDFCELDFWPIL